MFLLVFLVSFGPKKGTLTTYTDVWENTFLKPLGALLWHSAQKKQNQLPLTWTLFRFQFTLGTSRSTTYLLFFFWCFFFFFGEAFLLIIFNYNTLIDTIPASHFVFFKFHAIFLLDNSSSLLHEVTFFFILVCTLASLTFLLNLRVVSTSYAYLSTFHLDTLFVFLLSLSFGFYFYAPLLTWSILRSLYLTPKPGV